MSLLKSVALLVIALTFAAPRDVSAQDRYPVRPIHLIVGFAAGSSGDVAARIVGHKLGELLGQQIVVENRPGASSMIATDYVARSPKDGYTLLFGTIALTINPILMPTKSPDVEKDLAPIVLVGSIPNILVVSKDLNVSSVKELIALAKQKPDELLYGAAGLGSGPQMATELFKQMAGIKMAGVLYPGSAQTVMDLVSGRIQVMFSPASTVLGFIKDGRVKALPGYATGLWFGILGPAGTPKPIIDKISEAANKALKDPDVLRQLETQGLNALGGSPEDFGRYIKGESERWARILRDMDAAKANKAPAPPAQ
jgi:tripartite-type tricarboxylate transporter receptor subunit TctC